MSSPRADLATPLLCLTCLASPPSPSPRILRWESEAVCALYRRLQTFSICDPTFLLQRTRRRRRRRRRSSRTWQELH